MNLDSARAQLYAVPPGEFTSARATLVAELRAAGDTEGATALSGCRKPTVAAHLVNRWVRESPDLVDDLRALAADLGRAQNALDGPALRELGRARRALLERVVAEVRSIPDEPPSNATLDGVRDTVLAALASPEALAQAADGCLATTLSPAGFGAGTGPRAVPSPAFPAPQPVSGARDDAHPPRLTIVEATATVSLATARVAKAAAALDHATTVQGRARALVDRLRSELATATATARSVDAKVAAAQDALDAALAALTRAERAADGHDPEPDD